MPFRLTLTEDEDPMPLEFNCTIGYLGYLRSQLGGYEQPILPCLVFKIQSFGTLGPRLGVYLNGTPYDAISIGYLGERPRGFGQGSSDSGVDNTRVRIILEVDDEQLIELHRIYQTTREAEDLNVTWATRIPKEVIRPFDRQTSILAGKLKEALYERVPHAIECPHCEERHSRVEIDKFVKTRPHLGDLQSTDELEPRRIIITIRCPAEQREIEIDSV